MKKIIHKSILIVFISSLLLSCEDLEKVEVPNFDVSYTATAKAGESVQFTVNNSPNFVHFYSGELGHEYKYRTRTKAEGAVYMSFKNAQKWGLKDNAKGTLTVLASTDYDGSTSKEAIQSATWTDISDRFDISDKYTFDWTESGNADITNLDEDKPIYFAFRFYAEEHQGTGHRQPEWRLQDISIKKDLENSGNFLDILTAGTVDASGLNRTSVDDETFAWNAHQWYWDSGNKYWRYRADNPRHRNDDWLITNELNLSSILPDKGIDLKSYSEKLESFEYTFNTPGTYTVTFVGANETIYGREELIKEYTITITE